MVICYLHSYIFWMAVDGCVVQKILTYWHQITWFLWPKISLKCINLPTSTVSYDSNHYTTGTHFMSIRGNGWKWNHKTQKTKCLCIEVYRKTSFLHLFLLLQQWPTHFVHLHCVVCKMGVKLPYSCCFGECYFQHMFKTHIAYLCSSHLAFSPSILLV